MSRYQIRVNCEEKSLTDGTNRHILKQINREEKKKLSVFSELIKSLRSDRCTTLCYWINRVNKLVFSHIKKSKYSKVSQKPKYKYKDSEKNLNPRAQTTKFMLALNKQQNYCANNAK